jgi:hypothetical protein
MSATNDPKNEVDQNDPQQRLMLTELRLQATKQIVTLALASSAIPISVAGLINLKPPDTSDKWSLFWSFNEAGWLLMGFTLVFGYICISLAPRWVIKRGTWYSAALVFTYGAAPTCFVAGLISMGIAAFLAIRYGTPVGPK